MKKNLIFLFTFFCLTSFSLSQYKSHVFKGALIYPISGSPIENGVLIVKNGKIVSLGKESDLSIPSDAEVFDISGKVILPGLVDTHSHIGEGDGGDRSSSTHPDVRILDAIDPKAIHSKKH